MNPIVTQPAVLPLIPLWTATIAHASQPTVSARDLHTFLESRQDFSTWIKARIEQYDFVKDFDFLVIDLAPQENGALESTGYAQGRIEYYLTFDMAKELAMVERNRKGKEARQYFLSCEKALREQQDKLTPAESFLRSAQMMVAIEREQMRQAEEQALLSSRQDVTERRLDQIETAVDQFTVIGWHRAAHRGGELPLSVASRLGTLASKYCRANGVVTGTVPDPRFGIVNTYPKWVLDELFTQAVLGA